MRIRFISICLIIISLVLFNNCTKNITTPDRSQVKFDVEVYQECTGTRIPTPNVEVSIISLNQDLTIDDTIAQSNTLGAGNVTFNLNIPKDGLKAKIEAKVNFIDENNTPDTKIFDTTVVICDDAKLLIIFDCLIQGCLKIKRYGEPSDSLRDCPYMIKDLMYGQFNTRVRLRDSIRNTDYATKSYEIYNHNPIDVLCTVNLTPGPDADFLFRVSNLSQNIFIIPANDKIQIDVRFDPPTRDKFIEILRERTGNNITNAKTIDSMFKIDITIESATCVCSISDSVFVGGIVEPSINSCMVAYGQVTDKLPEPDWEVFIMNGYRRISLLNSNPDGNPPNPPNKDNCDIYITATNNYLPITPGPHNPTICFTDGILYEPMNNGQIYQPEEFINVKNMNTAMCQYILSNPQTIGNKKIENITQLDVGKVYVFQFADEFGLLYITLVDDGSSNELTHQSFVCFKALYPLFCQ